MIRIYVTYVPIGIWGIVCVVIGLNIEQKGTKMNNNGKIKIPKGHIWWESYLKDGEVRYIVTSNELRSRYYLYSVLADGKLNRIESNSIPVFKQTESLWEGTK